MKRQATLFTEKPYILFHSMQPGTAGAGGSRRPPLNALTKLSVLGIMRLPMNMKKGKAISSKLVANPIKYQAVLKFSGYYSLR